jgi:hypothetical protein
MLLFVFLQSIAAYPQGSSLPTPDLQDLESTLSIRAGTFYLRILPLGASITWGQESTDGNGYRKGLRDQLRFDGWNVNMVGSRVNGNMNDAVSLT